MTNTERSLNFSLSADEIAAAVSQRLDKYKTLDFHQQFAMFMGMGQILELRLKGLLYRRHDLTHEQTAKWTLGKLACELRRMGLRSDFCTLLDSVVVHRNHVAHDLLVSEALFRAFSGLTSASIEHRQLGKATYELEQVMILHDWCEEHDDWGPLASLPPIPPHSAA